MGVHDGQPVLEAGDPLGQGAWAVILLHGRNAGPENILDLVPRIGADGVTWIAPAAANRTWYPYSFMADLSANEPHLSSALALVSAQVARADAAGVTRDRIVLMGFSQGACLATEFAVRHAGRFGGVVAFSGGAIGPPGTRWDESGRFDGTPIFFGCSDIDSHVPAARVTESAALCSRMGALVTARLYPGMGHTINEDEIGWARELLGRR